VYGQARVWVHIEQSGLGVGVTIVYGQARVGVSPYCTVRPGCGVTIVYGRARIGVSSYCTVRPGCGHHHSVWSGWGRCVTIMDSPAWVWVSP